MKIKDLKFDKRNANRGTERGRALLEKSLQSYGAGRSILIDKNNNIIAGNKTVEVAGEAGFKTVRIIETDGKEIIAVKRNDLDLEKDTAAKELAIADNRTSELDLEWNSEELERLKNEGVDLGAFFSEKEFAEISADMETENTQDADAQIDQAAEINKKWKVKPGDLWLIGKHRLLCGDSTNEKDLIKLMNSEKGNCIFTDPPYGVAYIGGMKKRKALLNDHLKTNIYEKALPLLSRYVDEKAALYLWYADAHAAAGYIITAQIIWAKNHAQFLTSAHYKGKHEPCYYAHKKGKSARWYGPNNEVTLWEYDRSSSNDFHPTQKPVALAIRAINNSTKQKDIVLDGFLGGGTTMVACDNLKRQCRGLEISPDYCAVILDRMKNAFPDIEIKKV